MSARGECHSCGEMRADLMECGGEPQCRPCRVSAYVHGGCSRLLAERLADARACDLPDGWELEETGGGCDALTLDVTANAWGVALRWYLTDAADGCAPTDAAAPVVLTLVHAADCLITRRYPCLADAVADAVAWTFHG